MARASRRAFSWRTPVRLRRPAAVRVKTAATPVVRIGCTRHQAPSLERLQGRSRRLGPDLFGLGHHPRRGGTVSLDADQHRHLRQGQLTVEVHSAEPADQRTQGGPKLARRPVDVGGGTRHKYEV